MQNSPKKRCQGTCKTYSVATGSKIQTPPQNNVQAENLEAEKRLGISLSSINVVQQECSTSVPPSAKTEQAMEIIMASIEQESQLLPSGIPVSKIDANDYFLWQWERLARQLHHLNHHYADDSSSSMSELTDEPSRSSPLTISERALHLYKKAQDMGCPEWAKRFLQLIGYRILTISKGQLFLELGLDEVCTILESDHLDAADERNVLLAAHRWLDHDPGSRSQYVSRIMGCVRFGLMPKKDIIQCVVTRRRLRESIASLPPNQRSPTYGLIWLCMVDMGIAVKFTEFAHPPRYHPGVSKRKIGPQKCAKNTSDQLLDNGDINKKAIHGVSQATPLEVNRGPSGGRVGGRGKRI